MVAPARVDLSRVPLAPGGSDVSVAVEGQGKRQLSVWMPEGSGPHPLAVFLHGAGPSDGLVAGVLSCLVEPALAPLHPIILAPRSTSNGQWWMEADIAYVLGLVQAAHATWSTEPGHDLVLGYSNGGIGAWFFARQYPASFSAAIPMASSDSIIGATPLPVFAISGTKDELFPIEDTRRAIAGMKAQGQNVTLLERYRGSHFKACDYGPELEAARDWLTASVWTEPAGPKAAPRAQ